MSTERATTYAFQLYLFEYLSHMHHYYLALYRVTMMMVRCGGTALPYSQSLKSSRTCTVDRHKVMDPIEERDRARWA